MVSNKIVNKLAGLNHRNQAALMQRAEEINQWIRTNQKPRRKPRGQGRLPRTVALEKQVLTLAEKHLNGKYNVAAIVREIAHEERPRGRPDLKKLRHRVQSALKQLKQTGKIPKTSQFTLTAPKLREATREEIEKHMGLVIGVVRRGHRFFPRGWRRYISWEDAIRIGQKGLARAIETFDPRRGGTLKGVAWRWIGHAIGREISYRKRAKHHPRMVSLDAISFPGESATLHEFIGSPAPDVSVETELSKLLKSKATTPHHAMVYVLKNVYGHNFSDIARHFGAKKQAAHQVHTRAMQILEKVKRREERQI